MPEKTGIQADVLAKQQLTNGSHAVVKQNPQSMEIGRPTRLLARRVADSTEGQTLLSPAQISSVEHQMSSAYLVPISWSSADRWPKTGRYMLDSVWHRWSGGCQCRIVNEHSLFQHHRVIRRPVFCIICQDRCQDEPTINMNDKMSLCRSKYSLHMHMYRVFSLTTLFLCASLFFYGDFSVCLSVCQFVCVWQAYLRQEATD